MASRLIPKAFEQRIRDVRERARAALSRAEIIQRVGKKTGMHEGMTLQGARVLARALAKGKPNASVVLRFHAQNTPQKVGLIGPNQSPKGNVTEGSAPFSASDRAFSYSELDSLIDSISAALAERGLGLGSSALIVLKNRPEFIMIQSAIGRIGGSAVAASWRSTVHELEFVASHSSAKVVFFDVQITDAIRELQASSAVDPSVLFVVVGGQAEGFLTLDELIASSLGTVFDAGEDKSDQGAVVMYTSGTTGKPKGAVRRFQQNAFASALAFIGETPMRAGDVHLVVCPLYHATAFGFTGLSLLLGSSIVVMPEFRPDLFLEMVERYRVTTTAVVPTMLHRLLELDPEIVRKYDTSSLAAIFCGGAQLSAPLAESVNELWGDKLFNFYGSTETGIVTVAGPDDLRASPGTIGRPVPGVDIRLLDDAGNEVVEGSVGELFVRSALVIDGYHADEEGTQSSMREGYFSVGDLARRDKRGCYHIEGRKRDMIISGGVNIYPAEVEAVIDAHPFVAESAVIGSPDPEWGERVCAFVALKRGAELTVDELLAHCKTRLSGAKVPREFFFLDALPKNPTGKTLKRELRRIERDPSVDG